MHLYPEETFYIFRQTKNYPLLKLKEHFQELLMLYLFRETVKVCHIYLKLQDYIVMQFLLRYSSTPV